MADERILIADDDASVRKTVRLVLEAEGYAVETAADGGEALKALGAGKFDALLLDLKLPVADGFEILHAIADKKIDTTVIMITAFGSIDSAVEAVKAGAFHYVTKPIDMDALKLLIRQGLEKRGLIDENRMLRKKLNEKSAGVVGQSRAMQEVYELVRLAAGSDGNVLILGETGTGKEVIADGIHYASARRDAAFIKVNCAALPESILESELFGHEKGAFTDAKNLKKGVFELADGGTLLFDEIGCMSAGTQAKLLRVLEDKKVKRLGGETEFRVDVRIIASTNEELEKSIETRAFRSDLYYRLNVLKIKLPPLRDRREDIPQLAGHFIEKHRRAGTPETVTVDAAAMDALTAYRWPGNVRELENVIQRALIFDSGDCIRREHLPSELLHSVEACGPDAGKPASMEDVQLDVIRKALERTGGNITQAAGELGVSRNYIKRHLSGKENDEH